jgi:hypothetical protein
VKGRKEFEEWQEFEEFKETAPKPNAWRGR